MERCARIALMLFLSTAAVPLLAGEKIKEPSTGVSFAGEEDGLSLLGVGVRKMLVVKVYAAALYVDADGLKKAVGDKGVSGVNRALHNGAFRRRILLHFVRNVPAEKIQEAFRDSLVSNMSKEDYAAEKQRIDEFLASCTAVKKGEVFEYESSGNSVKVKLGGKVIFKADSKRLMRGMWGSYFGKRPINERLRKDLQKGAAELFGAP